MTLEQANALLAAIYNERNCPACWVERRMSYRDGHYIGDEYYVSGADDWQPSYLSVADAFSVAKTWLESLTYEPPRELPAGSQYESCGKWYAPDGSFLCSAT